MNAGTTIKPQPIKCDVCGRFVSYDDLISERAFHTMKEPDSHFGPEVFETYHAKCDCSRGAMDRGGQ